MEILKRYRIEPRGSWGRNSNSFLLVFDKKKNQYLEEIGNNHHAYMRFNNSDEILTYLEKLDTMKEN